MAGLAYILVTAHGKPKRWTVQSDSSSAPSCTEGASVGLWRKLNQRKQKCRRSWILLPICTKPVITTIHFQCSSLIFNQRHLKAAATNAIHNISHACNRECEKKKLGQHRKINTLYSEVMKFTARRIIQAFHSRLHGVWQQWKLSLLCERLIHKNISTLDKIFV